MHDLEIQAKPILTNLIDDPHRLVALTDQERGIVARWTLKTAAALNRSSSYGMPGKALARPVPNDQMKILADGGMPNDVAVVGRWYDSLKPFDWLQYVTWAAPASHVRLLDQDCTRSYKIAIAFMDLVLIAAYYPSAEFLYAVIEGEFVPLWEGERGIKRVPRVMAQTRARTSSPVLEGFLRDILVSPEHGSNK